MQRTVRHRITRSVLAVVGALLVYVLAIGPLGYAQYRLGRPVGRVAETFYAPLKLLPKPRLLAAAFNWYVELWLGPGDCGGAGPGG